VVVRHSEFCLVSSFTVLNRDGEIYIWTAGFLYGTYVKNKKNMNRLEGGFENPWHSSLKRHRFRPQPHGEWLRSHVYCRIQLDRFKSLNKAHFCNWFSRAVHGGALDSKSYFSPMKLGSIWVGISMLRRKGTGAVLIRDRILKYPFTIRISVYGVLLLLHEW
jgi:hypothetical protein